MLNLKFAHSSLSRRIAFIVGSTLISFSTLTQAAAPDQDSRITNPAPVAKNADEALNLAIFRENKLDAKLRTMHPVIETYVQQMQPDRQLESVPKTDTYFLGKLDLSNGVNHDSYMREPGFFTRTLESVGKMKSNQFLARGFAQMVIMDDGGLNRSNYKFEYVRREFLGDVRCLVYDVTPLKSAGFGRFIGRVWVEDQDYNVVRFKGTYGPAPRNVHYIHFDSWRVNTAPHLWLPAYIYTEESAMQKTGSFHTLSFKAQVRLWGYQSKEQRMQQEFTNISVDGQSSVNDKSEQAADYSTADALRSWHREAEENALTRLTDSGILAPSGEVDKVLQTVVDNLQITNNLNLQPEVHVRVMMTTPLEAGVIGHTIVISRGLLDVLPDEPSLAAVLAEQLAHVALGHQLDTAYSFNDRLFFDDDQTLRQVSFARSEEEEAAADQKAVELLQKSPYADKLPNAGLFLRMLAARKDQIPRLVKPLLSNGMVAENNDVRLAALLGKAPELDMTKGNQIAALSLGSRIKINPWNNQLQLVKTHSSGALTAKEKLPFEVTPNYLHLTRFAQVAAAGDAQPASNSEATQNKQTSSLAPAAIPTDAPLN